MSQEMQSVAKLALRLGSLGCLVRLALVGAVGMVLYTGWHFLQKVW